MHWPDQRGNRALALAEAAWAGSGKKGPLCPHDISETRAVNNF